VNESCGLSSAVLAAAVASASGAVTAASMLLIFFNDAAYDDDDVVRLLLTIIDEDGDWMGMEVGGGRWSVCCLAFGPLTVPPRTADGSDMVSNDRR